MSLTSTQKSKIRSFLGYQSYELDEAFEELAGDATKETMVTGLITAIETIDTSISSGIAGTGVWSTGKNETEMNRSVYLQELRRQGRILISRIAKALNVPNLSEWF